MIFDTIENAGKYAGLFPNVDCVLASLKDIKAEAYPEKKVTLDGDNAFLLPNAYKTHCTADAKFEAHCKYADVMYMVEGEEIIYVKPTKDLKKITMPYKDDCDALLAEFEEGTSSIRLTAGSFVILLPEDAHAPACCADAPSEVKKIIGKARV